MKKHWFVLMLVFVVSTVNAAMSSIQGAAITANVTEDNLLPIKGVIESTDGIYNLKSFVVEASETGNYHIGLWFMPAKLPNNKFTTFKVFVNDSYAGSVTPSIGNWQFAQLDGNESIVLQEGSNIVSIATEAPEFPSVESIKISQNNSDVFISSFAYDEYIDEIANNLTYTTSAEEEVSMKSAGVTYYTNVPLRYTFYRVFSFTKDEEVFITSSSKSEHVIDMVLRGTPYKYKPSESASTLPDQQWINPAIADLKPIVFYTPATSEEMQGLNWRNLSEKVINSSTQAATIKLTIPVTGVYLIRLRTKENGTQGIADLNVNGKYYYEDCPISFTAVDCVIPADGNEYATMTNCASSDTDNPIIFIHGAGADRVVGFNDDGPEAKLSQYNLSSNDAYISQKYFMPTERISVSNYSSQNPVSKCNILARVEQQESSQAITQMMPKANCSTEIKKRSKSDIINIANIIGHDNNLSVSADINILSVSAFNILGKRIGYISADGNKMEIPISSLNISQTGIYVIQVETSNGVCSQKVMIK